jgi:multiple sugar transport system substrate-binding protein
MAVMARRDVLKLLGASALTAGCALTRRAAAAIPELRYRPEQDARLRFVRWRNLNQGEDDQWMANTRKFTEQTGVPVQVENISLEEVWAKAAVSANVGAGPDIVMGAGGQAQLYPDHCLDLTELADYLGVKYGGWYDAVKACCVTGSRWIAVGMGFSTACVVYRQSMVEAAGFRDIPRDLPGFLQLCQALKARGTPPGLALGNAPIDATIWCHWLIWTHDARLVDEENRVAINSKETIAALEYAKQLYPTFVPGTLSWLDPTNNLAFLTGQISLTYNAISIYYVAKTSTAPHLKAIAADIQHAHLPIGPVGRPTELAVFAPVWIFNYTRFPNAAREYLRFMLEREQYELWEKASLGYFSQPLRAYESDPMWSEDPKCTPFRDGPAMTLHAGYAGKAGAASAASAADFIVVNMVAEAATGQSTPSAAAARAEQRARRYYKS